MAQRIEISYRTIIFTLAILIGAWFLYQIRDILLLLFISLILMGALNPTINKLEKWRLPRWLAILVVYIVVVGLFIGSLAGIVPALVDQTGKLVQLVVESVAKTSFFGFSAENLNGYLSQLGGLPSQILKIAVSAASNVLSIFVVLVITFYLLLEHKNLNHYLFYLFGREGKRRAKKIVTILEKKLGGWVRAELFLMVIVGALSYFGFKILNLKSALPLAILAGILEVVPNIGPTVAAVPAVLVGFLETPLIGFLVLAWCFVVQQLENNLIVPKVMQKSTGVNPLVTILSLAVGFKLAGVIGAILAVPLYLFFETLAKELLISSYKNKRR